MIELYILRHGQTEWNREDRIQGRQDSPLTEAGIEEIEKMAKTLAHLPFRSCYCSDLGRAKKTAEILRNDRKFPIIEVEALRELPLGPWEGKLFSEIQDDPMCKIYFESPEAFGFSGTENFHDLYRKIESFLRHIETEETGPILVVAHGVSIRAMLNCMEGVSIENFWHRPIPESAGLSVARYDEKRWEVLQTADKKDGVSY
ncbi:Alpha-ribazole phosphatase [Aedoeadaptatus ivorii]|uniref:Alpha-ribazole phosphatase n=1 Tax=Aedoeadaptatus ivorii TaxID=54006 RepID=A0A448V0R5_9FIRM|nr:histidine phosphatase family protein [Peptoniphilus ivorii]MDQ0507571.1 putative phosphoglycerate mutase [Peptoniphilus ivorii]VEJ35179.1 Alpha-ribazole phosphatase [Peptoniphilus ivorii]